MNGRTLKKNNKFVVHLFLIKTFLFEQDDPIEKNYSIMAKINTILFFNEPLIM
jgi:hypothetical protein